MLHQFVRRVAACGLLPAILMLVAPSPAVAGPAPDNSLAAVPLPLSDQYTDRVTDPDRTLGSNRRR